MEAFEFIFWEAMKVLGLSFLALLAVKIVSSLPASGLGDATRLRKVKAGLYSVIVALVVIGAWNAGYDLAAESYFWGSQRASEAGRSAKAYDDGLRAVHLRPGIIGYWRALVNAKMNLRQFESALDDLAAFESLGGGQLQEEDAYRFALCSYILGRYGDVTSVTQRLIHGTPAYAAPYILQGLAYLSQKKYPEAEQSFAGALRVLPNHQAAVEGLAHAYFLAGDRAQALSVLDETTQRPFSPQARERFQALKALYAQ
jgi:tetratricopeptide (TPR) repeat protein